MVKCSLAVICQLLQLCQSWHNCKSCMYVKYLVKCSLAVICQLLQLCQSWHNCKSCYASSQHSCSQHSCSQHSCSYASSHQLIVMPVMQLCQLTPAHSSHLYAHSYASSVTPAHNTLAVMPAHHKDFCLAMQLTEGTHVYSWFIHSTPTAYVPRFRPRC